MSLGGPTYLAAIKLQRMVSLSANFQAAVGAADAAHALTSIGMKQAQADKPRPYGIVSAGERLNYKFIAGGTQIQLAVAGSVFLYLACDVDPQYVEDDIQAEFAALSFFHQVIDDVASLSGLDDSGSADGTSHLNIMTIDQIVFGSNPQEEWQSLGRFYFAGFDCGWA